MSHFSKSYLNTKHIKRKPLNSMKTVIKQVGRLHDIDRPKNPLDLMSENLVSALTRNKCKVLVWSLI